MPLSLDVRVALGFLCCLAFAACSDASESVPAGSFGIYAVVEGGSPTAHWDPMEPEVALAATPELTGADIAKVEEGTDSFTGRPQFVIHFEDAAGERFAEFTGAHVDEKIAFVVDGRVVTAPVVMEPITGGRAMLPVTPAQRPAMRAALGFDD